MSQRKTLIRNVLKGDRRAIAKAISLVENQTSEAEEIVAALYKHTGKARILGVTGSTGSGKSTLIERLIEEFRKKGETVGVIAVDPTSPFTGGAFLGDRIRMQKHCTDKDVFIRSMASRNSLGGLARTTKDVVKILDAAGKDIVIVETVGAGQTEVDIVRIAHTVVVVLAPGFGDEIQAIKAGIMEIGDIFLVNKADLENADKAVTNIQAMLELSSEKNAWKPPVVKVSARDGEGINNLLKKLNEHQAFLKENTHVVKQKERIESELVELIKERAAAFIIRDLVKNGELKRIISKVSAREVDPYSAVDDALKGRLRNLRVD